MSQFLLPDLGEGLEEAQLVQWLVQVGDAIHLNQPICQVETAKALVDIPSPYAGTVRIAPRAARRYRAGWRAAHHHAKRRTPARNPPPMKSIRRCWWATARLARRDLRAAAAWR